MTTTMTITMTTVPAGSATPTNLPASAPTSAAHRVEIATREVREPLAPAA